VASTFLFIGSSVDINATGPTNFNILYIRRSVGILYALLQMTVANLDSESFMTFAKPKLLIQKLDLLI